MSFVAFQIYKWQLDNHNLDMNIDQFKDIYKQQTIIVGTNGIER